MNSNCSSLMKSNLINNSKLKPQKKTKKFSHDVGHCATNPKIVIDYQIPQNFENSKKDNSTNKNFVKYNTVDGTCHTNNELQSPQPEVIKIYHQHQLIKETENELDVKSCYDDWISLKETKVNIIDDNSSINKS